MPRVMSSMTLAGRVLDETAPGLLDIGRTMLQTTYVDIGRR